MLYESYCNEIENDRIGLVLSMKSNRVYNSKYLFKNYKINNMNKRNYYAFYYFVEFYNKVWLVSLLFFFIQFIFSLFLPRINKIKKNKIGLIHSRTSKDDINLIEDDDKIDYVYFNFIFLSNSLKLKQKVIAFYLTVGTIFEIFKKKNDITKKEYNSLKLHIYDLYKLSLFMQLMNSLESENTTIYSNSHYQRYVYLLSKISNLDLCIIQHGFLSEVINFKYKFGSIKMLYIYDELFLNQFRLYYNRILNYTLVKPKLNFINIEKKDTKKIIFIASSMFSLKYELELVRLLLKSDCFKIFIKLHPAYNYKKEFTQYYESVIFTVDFITCDYMISYNSFLGYKYKALGQKVIFLEKYIKNINKLIDELKGEY